MAFVLKQIDQFFILEFQQRNLTSSSARQRPLRFIGRNSEYSVNLQPLLVIDSIPPFKYDVRYEDTNVRLRASWDAKTDKKA